MPIKIIRIKGKKYYKYGDNGKPYINREDTLKQMRAIKSSQSKIRIKATSRARGHERRV